jgi:hypothetical protein
MKHVSASLVGGLGAAFLAVVGLHGQSQPAAAVEAHAYYLFLADPPKGCEGCYIPLLVTTTRLEAIAKEKRDEPSILITTYERDSLVGPPRRVIVADTDVSTPERHVRVQDRRYHYQEISASEVLALLERPNGVIPISRTSGMSVPSARELADLIARFRAVKE